MSGREQREAELRDLCSRYPQRLIELYNKVVQPPVPARPGKGGQPANGTTLEEMIRSIIEHEEKHYESGARDTQAKKFHWFHVS